MNRNALTLVLLMAVVPGIAMSASVYKWTDKEGVTHFGDRQPVGANSETVNVRSGTSSGTDNSRPSPQQRLGDLQERQQAETEKSRKQR